MLFRKKVLYWITLCAVSIGFALMTIGWRRCPPVDGFFFFSFTLLFALVVFFLFVLVAAVLLRNEPYSHRDVKKISTLALIGFVLLACGGAAVWNGSLDKSEISVHDVPILDRGHTRLPPGRKYFVWTTSWRGGNTREQLFVSEDTYNLVQPGASLMRVRTREGALGFECFEDYHLVR